MIAKSFSRPTRPYLANLLTTLTPLLAVANAGSFHLAWDGANIIVEQDGWSGVDLAAVQAAVTNALEWTAKLEAKERAKQYPTELWAAFRVLVKYDNGTLTAGTIAKFKTDVLAEVDLIS